MTRLEPDLREPGADPTTAGKRTHSITGWPLACTCDTCGEPGARMLSATVDKADYECKQPGCRRVFEEFR